MSISFFSTKNVAPLKAGFILHLDFPITATSGRHGIWKGVTAAFPRIFCREDSLARNT